MIVTERTKILGSSFNKLFQLFQSILSSNVKLIAICFFGGFQLEFISISRVINHMTCYNSESHWWKIYLQKNPLQEFALQSECGNFSQWEHSNYNWSCDLWPGLYLQIPNENYLRNDLFSSCKSLTKVCATWRSLANLVSCCLWASSFFSSSSM